MFLFSRRYVMTFPPTLLLAGFTEHPSVSTAERSGKSIRTTTVTSNRHGWTQYLAGFWLVGVVVMLLRMAERADHARGASHAGQPPLAAMAIGRGQSHSLLAHIRRVLLASEKPNVHVSRTSLTGLMVLATLPLAILWQAATVKVAIAAEVMSPAERVQRIAEQVEDHAPVLVGDDPVTFSGTIRTEDGSPLPNKVWGTSHTRSENDIASSSLGDLKSEFKITAKPGVTWIVVHSEDYAAGVAGPFDGRSGTDCEEIEIVLTKGFPVEFTVQDEAGNAVAGATVSGGYIVGESSSHSQKGQSDAQGKGFLPHVLAGEHYVTAKAPGYQDTGSTRKKLKRGETLLIVLRKAQPVTGQVVTTDGTPIAGAVLQEFVTMNHAAGSGQIHGPYGGKLATTDDEGRFTLDQLVSDRIYYMLVSHPDHGKRAHEGVRAGQNHVQLTLGPDFTLEGILEGDLSKLPHRRGEPYIHFRQEVPVGTERFGGWNGDEATVERTETGGRFNLRGLLPAETTITAGEHNATVNLTEPTSRVTIDLNEPATPLLKRQVELTFETEALAPPQGSVEVSTSLDGGPQKREQIAVEAGRVRLDVEVGAHVRISPNGLIGYWFPEQAFSLEAGEGPHRVPIETFPAGAISGQVVMPDGQPATSGVSVEIRAFELPKGVSHGSVTPYLKAPVDARGRFIITPLPLDAKYAIIAGRKYNRVASDPVHLTEADPIGNVQLRLSPDVSATGFVVGPTGQPLTDILMKLILIHPIAGSSWGPGFATDHQGRFQFDGLSSTMDGYEIWLLPTKDYQPRVIPVSPGGPPVTIKLEKGFILECAVLDAETGRPIPGVQLYAHPLERQGEPPYPCKPEGRTAADGTTRFSNLAGRDFQIHDRNGLTWDKEKGKLHIPSQTIPLVIEATLPEWSRLKLEP